MERKKKFESQAGRGTVPARAVDGEKERKLSRRRHQDGQLIKLANGWAVRFYEDILVNGERRRERKQVFLGDSKKLGTRRAAENAMDQELGTRGVNDFTLAPKTTTPFREAAWAWIAAAEKRRLKPVKPSVLRGWRRILNSHVLPVLGDVPVSDVRNRAMRTLVELLVEKGLGASTIRNVTNTVKLTIAAAVDHDGNQLYPVKWNTRFIDAPSPDPTGQRRPTFDAEQVAKIVQTSFGRMQMAAVLFASTGLRAGEMLGLEIKHFDGSAIRVEQEVWRGLVLAPKTPNARRVVDLHPDVAALLTTFIGKRRSGFLFCTASGKPMNQRNLARALYKVLDTLEIPRRGFHAFRRYRNTFLRNALCPDGVLKYWMGHAGVDMTDRYDRSRDDVQFRRDVARSLGVGFPVPTALTPKWLAPKKHKRPKAGVAVGSECPKVEFSGVIGRRAEVQPLVSP